jgi:hypothetical protein
MCQYKRLLGHTVSNSTTGGGVTVHVPVQTITWLYGLELDNPQAYLLELFKIRFVIVFCQPRIPLAREISKGV